MIKLPESMLFFLCFGNSGNIAIYELLVREGLLLFLFIDICKNVCCIFLLRYGKRKREEIHLVLYSIKVNHNIASNVPGYLCVYLNWEFA